MKTILNNNITRIAAAMLLSLTSLFAAPYEKGQKVESFQAKDQHDQAFTFKPAETRFLLVTHDMDTGKKANAVLTTLGKDHLSNNKAIYLANIHGMPGIGRAFALPKMRKYAHRIILGDDAALIARFPVQAGKVSILKLRNSRVVSIQYWSPGVDALDPLLK
jgi:hypothetical protein